MKNINYIEELHEAIRVLEAKQVEDRAEITACFYTVYDKFKPANIIKSTLDDLTDSRFLKGSLLQGGLAIALGYLTKKVTFGSSKNMFMGLLGNLVQAGVTGIAAKEFSRS